MSELDYLNRKPWRVDGCGRPLAPMLRSRLESLMQVDLGGVRVFSHPAASLLGGAFAFGDDICVSPSLQRLPAISLDFVLAHEAAHVVQQRLGRTRQRDSVVVCSGLLEREADRIAFAATGCASNPAPILLAEGAANSVAQPVFQLWKEAAAIIKDLDEFKQYLTEPLYEDLKAIADLLENEERVQGALKALEADLVEQRDKAILEIAQPREGKVYGALKDALTVLEFKNSLSVVEGLHKTPVLTGFVPPPMFCEHLLHNGYHWKDPGAGADHGEHTHRIQWNIVMRTLTGKRESFLNIFKTTAYMKSLSAYADKNLTIWDVLFDRFTQGQVERDVPRSESAAAPNFLHSYIMNTGPFDKWPMLRSYTQRRFEKRQNELIGFMFSEAGNNLSDTLTTKLKAGRDISDIPQSEMRDIEFQVQQGLAGAYWIEKYAKKYFAGDVEKLKAAIGDRNIYFPERKKP